MVRDTITWTHVCYGWIRVAKVNSCTEQVAGILLHHLLAHFPEIVYTPAPTAELHLSATPRDHPLIATVSTLEQSRPEARLQLNVAEMELLLSSEVTSMQDANHLINKAANGEVMVRAIHPHPSLSRMVRLWTNSRQWTRSRRKFKQAATATSRRHGLRKVGERAQEWRQDNTMIANALAKLSWKQLHKITGATAWGVQVVYRLKLRAFSRWDPTRNCVSCPIEECRQIMASPGHTFWTCTGAEALWKHFCIPWAALGQSQTDARTKATFGLELLTVPPNVWELLDDIHATSTELERTDIRREIFDLLNQCWRLGVTATLQAIWKRRCRYRDPQEDTGVDRAIALLEGRLRAAYLTVRILASAGATPTHRVAAAKLCYRALTQARDGAMPSPTPYMASDSYVLLFDGGSRGNPGPGGSGAMIARVGGAGHRPAIIWMASISTSHRTTTNIAEYKSLLIGLRNAARLRLHGIHVAGDSAIILDQLRHRKPPRARHLQSYYTQCRLLADRLMVASWAHHLRHFNKAADSLANLAMDTKTSIQILRDDLQNLPQRWITVSELLQGDVAHWMDMHPDQEEHSRPPANNGTE